MPGWQHIWAKQSHLRQSLYRSLVPFVARRWYYPYGEERYAIGALPTDRLFTGQRWDGALALYDYRARYYDPLLGRFISADPLVPEPGNPQALNRYAYVYNNPLRYIDPFGYFSEEAIKDYLRRTYGEQWEDIYSQWKANEAWWTMLLEAQPGDILVIGGDQERRSYGLILGDTREQGTEDDVLLGIAPTKGIPRAFEELEVGELQNVGAWVREEVIAIARLESGGRMIRYWEPRLKEWSNAYFNLPTIYRPDPGARIASVGQGLIVGFGSVMEAEILAVGSEALSGGLAGVPVTIICWGAALWIAPSLYNIAMMPTME